LFDVFLDQFRIGPDQTNVNHFSKSSFKTKKESSAPFLWDEKFRVATQIAAQTCPASYWYDIGYRPPVLRRPLGKWTGQPRCRTCTNRRLS
ncbi:MAG TPA: hypothetical protein DCL14_04485, partial [Ruminococcaceae bacterium]|nr:hypothetical protein [Oscillospiraceae bacterium]